MFNITTVDDWIQTLRISGRIGSATALQTLPQLLPIINFSNTIFFLSIVLGGVMVYWHWEAMVTSYLSARVTTFPFKDLAGIVEASDFKIGTVKG